MSASFLARPSPGKSLGAAVLASGHASHGITAGGLTVREALADHGAAMEWFTAEWHVLKAIIGAVAVSNEFRSYTWQLALRLQQFRQRQGHWQDWRSIMKTALSAAEAENDLPASATTRESER